MIVKHLPSKWMEIKGINKNDALAKQWESDGTWNIKVTEYGFMKKMKLEDIPKPLSYGDIGKKLLMVEELPQGSSMIHDKAFFVKKQKLVIVDELPGEKVEVKHLPRTWCKIKEIELLDYAGWDKYYPKSWNIPISENEFMVRLSRCAYEYFVKPKLKKHSCLPGGKNIKYESSTIIPVKSSSKLDKISFLSPEDKKKLKVFWTSLISTENYFNSMEYRIEETKKEKKRIFDYQINDPMSVFILDNQIAIMEAIKKLQGE